MSGLFGVASKKSCMETLMYGIDYHSHLGTEYGGLAVSGEELTRQIHSISTTQFKSKFYDDVQRIKGNMGIGVISDSDEQPIYLKSKFGPIAIVTCGIIENSGTLADELMSEGHSFAEVSRGPVNKTELIAKIITTGKDIVSGVEKVFSSIEGSCSLLLLNKDGIYAARDRYGYTPLAVGRSGDAWAVASETTAFPNNDFEIVKYLEPGEVVLLTPDGLIQKRQGGNTSQICTFLWIYTGFPASSYEGINAEIVREKCGRLLAKKDKDIEVDLVSGVPDSGVGHAIGYAMESGKPYRRPLVKYTPGYGRSYIPPSQKKRDLIAKMKLVPIKDIINGKRIVVCEDSIVRGTQLKNFTINKLMHAGAKEVHVRPACPPLMFPCIFNLSTRSADELIARRAIKDLEKRDITDVSEYVDHTTEKYRSMVEWIRRDIGITTLRYQTIDDMVKAIGLPKERLCLYCWTGECRTKCGACKKSAGELASV